MDLSPVEPSRNPVVRALTRVEDGFAIAVLALMVVLPIVRVLVRWSTGLDLAELTITVQSLCLWLAIAGAALAARSGSHLALSTGALLELSERVRSRITLFTAAVSTAVAA
ncbi:MAG: hypothetical protein QGH45_25670, partial [Myxococcota bacterium]|nr:hypothetical protein [Myxococcota bacterium]